MSRPMISVACAATAIKPTTIKAGKDKISLLIIEVCPHYFLCGKPKLAEEIPGIAILMTEGLADLSSIVLPHHPPKTPLYHYHSAEQLCLLPALQRQVGILPIHLHFASPHGAHARGLSFAQDLSTALRYRKHGGSKLPNMPTDHPKERIRGNCRTDFYRRTSDDQ